MLLIFHITRAHLVPHYWCSQATEGTSDIHGMMPAHLHMLIVFTSNNCVNIKCNTSYLGLLPFRPDLICGQCVQCWMNCGIHIEFKPLLYPPLQRSWKGVYWFHLVCLSVHPSVRLSICEQNRVCSASSTILTGSISHLHILSSNFRRCVGCNVCLKNS